MIDALVSALAGGAGALCGFKIGWHLQAAFEAWVKRRKR